MAEMYPSEKDGEYLVPISKHAMDALRAVYPHRFPNETFSEYVRRWPKAGKAD